MGSLIGKLLREYGGRYPALSGAMSSAVANSSQDQAEEFGLDRILDGIELLIARRDQPEP